VKGRVFLDTNILIYADDADAGTKRDRAQQIIEAALNNGNGVLSTQVLQEYFVVATKKLGLPAEIAQQKVEILATLNVIVVDVEHVVEANQTPPSLWVQFLGLSDPSLCKGGRVPAIAVRRSAARSIH